MFRRVSAGTYLLAMSSAINLWCIGMIALYRYGIASGALGAAAASYVNWALAAPVGYLFFRISRGRLQDLNCPGSWGWVLAFPFLAVLILPVLCFLPGPRYSNDFGDPPEPSSFLKRLAALASFAIALVLVPYVTRLFRSVPLA
jgi:hypothetical protein